MNRWLAVSMAQRLMREHGLDGWSFAFNRRKRSMGLCWFEGRRIELSLPFVERNDETSVRDTILHEIAHALAGPEAGHGPTWKRIAATIGAVPERCGEANMPKGRWRATCPGCTRQYSRHRRPVRGSTYYCRSCGRDGGVLKFEAATAK